MEKFRNKYRIPSARASWWNYGWAGAYFITICTKDRNHYFGEIKNGEMKLSPCGILADVFWHEIKNHAIDIELGAFVVMPNHIHGILILNTDNHLLRSDNPDTMGNNSAINFENDIEKIGEIGSGILGNIGNCGNEIENIVGIDDIADIVNIGENGGGGNGGGGNGGGENGGGENGGGGNVQTGHAPSLAMQSQSQSASSLSQSSPRNIGKNSVSSIIGGYKSAVTKHANRLGLDFGWQTRFHDHIIRNDSEYQRINDYIEDNPKKWDADKFF